MIAIKSVPGHHIFTGGNRMWTVRDMGVITAAALIAIGMTLIPISKETVRADIEATLAAAHDTVEEYRRVNDRLPERIPVTALAGLVRLNASTADTA